MNIENERGVYYKLFPNVREKEQIQIIANTFYYGNTCAALSDIIADGIQIAESIQSMMKDSEYTEEMLQNCCEVTADNIHRRWKGKQDASNSE